MRHLNTTVNRIVDMWANLWTNFLSSWLVVKEPSLVLHILFMFINYDVSSEITDHNWPLIVSPPCLSSQGELIILTSKYSESVQLFCTVQYTCTVTGNRMKAWGILTNPQGITTWPFNVAVLPDSQCWQDCLWPMGFS